MSKMRSPEETGPLSEQAFDALRAKVLEESQRFERQLPPRAGVPYGGLLGMNVLEEYVLVSNGPGRAFRILW
jgi:hypothetical protein